MAAAAEAFPRGKFPFMCSGLIRPLELTGRPELIPGASALLGLLP